MPKISQVNLPIFIGHRCNYSCQECSSGSDFIKDSTDDPTLEEIISVIPTLAEKFEITDMISLQGGEPFLYWNDKILPLVAVLRQHFLSVPINIFTNGQLIGKNMDKVLDLCDNFQNISFTISKHLVGVTNSFVAKKWQQSIDLLETHPQIVKIHDNHYHVKDNIGANIYFYEAKYWSSNYYEVDDKKIKPWATNDPINSMKTSCIGNCCSYLFGTKLYKCGKLAHLPVQLKHKLQLDDPDWKKYLNYTPVDLTDIDPEVLQDFIDTYTKPVDVCDMCSNEISNSTLWKERTYEMIFYSPNTP